MKSPLVTISIPTLNSAAFIETCLQAIQKQTYGTIEINLVDGGSTDATVSIAKKSGVRTIIDHKGSLLEARYEGAKRARGKYILLLDSDQVLEKTAIERAVKLAETKHVPIIALEEHVYRPRTWLERLFEQDRKLINRVEDLDPFTGVILPRFYERKLLLEAFETIPGNVLKEVGGQDHAIIYFEAWQREKNVSQIPGAVYHIEPHAYPVMWKKFYRWGSTSVTAHHPRYAALLERKERFRTGLFRPGLMTASVASIFLLILKGVPYKLGYFMTGKQKQR